MKAIAVQTMKNMQRHFIVWGALAVIVMFAGMSENQSNANSPAYRPDAKGTYSDVMSKHTCKDTVDNKYPKAIIGYNLHTGGHFYSEKPADIANALNEEFGDYNWHGFEVRHFCK